MSLFEKSMKIPIVLCLAFRLLMILDINVLKCSLLHDVAYYGDWATLSLTC